MFCGLAIGQTSPQTSQSRRAQQKNITQSHASVESVRASQTAKQAAAKPGTVATKSASAQILTPIAKEQADQMRLDEAMKNLRAAAKDQKAQAAANPQTATQSIAKAHAPKAPVAAPFECTFDVRSDFTNYWYNVDQDGDEFAWFHGMAIPVSPSYDGTDEGGYVLAGDNVDDTTASAKNFLITKNPITLSQGNAYVTFAHSTNQSKKSKERLRVYCSKTLDTLDCDVTKMTLVGEMMDSTKGWKHCTMPFTIAEAGNYYFYFMHCSDPQQYAFYMDNIEIGEGTFVGEAELKMEALMLPTSSCGLNQESIGFKLRNIGDADLVNFKLSYIIDGGTPVEQIFAGPIKPYATATLYFTQKADLSAFDAETYGQKYEVKVAYGEDTLKGSVTHFTPGNLPLVANLRAKEVETEDGIEYEPLMNVDTVVGYDPNAWIFDEVYNAYVAISQGSPLMLRCVNLQAEKQYRFSYNYMVGRLFYEFFLETDEYDVLYGKSGTDITKWDTLFSYVDYPYTNDMPAYDEAWFSVKEAGQYSFAVLPRVNLQFPNSAQTITVMDMMVEAVPEHDIKVADVISSIASRTPARHVTKGEFNALVVNRGYSEEAGVKLTAKQGETTVGVSEVKTIGSADSAEFPIVGPLTAVAGTTVNVDFTATMTATDNKPDNNVFRWSFEATDGLYAFDKDIDEYEDGIGGTTLPMGQIFTLIVPDTITGVVCGWFDISPYVDTTEEMPVGVEIYTLKGDGTVGNCLLMHTFARQWKGNYQTVEIPARALPAGDYFVALRQLTKTNFGVGYDGDPHGLYFYLKENKLYYDNEYGNLAVRAKFGHPETLVQKDIELLGFYKPKDRGVFTANEAIEVDYRNNGEQTVNAEFKCTVDGVALPSQKIAVKGYQISYVTFKADLSKVGTHDIKVEVVVEGDENTADNAIEKTVTTLEVFPYEMTFETSDDFAIDGDLVPWKGVDVDGYPTYDIWGMQWPNVYLPQAFIAYNPVVVGLDYLITPNGGDRIGCAWGADNYEGGTSDDWLISPKLKMPKTGSKLEFYVNSLKFSDEEVYVEKYEVYVSTTNDKPASFTKLGETYETTPGEWVKTEVDLSAYNGQEIYVSIRAFETNWCFMIDDVKLSNPAGVEETTDLSAYIKSYPNPVSDVWTVLATGVDINKVELYNLMGSLVYRSADNLSAGQWRLNMADFTPGLYTARVYTSMGVQTIKVTVR